MQSPFLFPLLSDASLALRLDAPGKEAAAAALAARLAIPLLAEKGINTKKFLLHWQEQGLALRKPGDRELPGALRVDFCQPAMRRRLAQCRQELVVRAAKIRNLDNALLLDATAGLGRDGFLLAAAGFHVCMFERHPVMAALLRDGLERAALHPETAPVAARITLIEDNALAVLTATTELRPKVIYLDPMFPRRMKSAKVKQEARLLQHLDLGDNGQEAELLRAALALQPKKVVLKRPLQGGKTTLPPPSYSIKGKAVRYEVYVTHASF